MGEEEEVVAEDDEKEVVYRGEVKGGSKHFAISAAAN